MAEGQLGSLVISLLADIARFKEDMGKASQAAQTASNNMAASFDRAGSSIKSSMSDMAKAAAAAFGAFQAAGVIRDSTMLAARVETLGTVMKVIGNNAGYSGAQMTAFENQVKAMGITTQEARNNLTRMASSQMDLTKASDLARIAQDAGRIGNINSSEAFARLIQGVRSGEVEVLRNIGINVMFEEGYKKTAAALGTTSEKLSVAEKMTSRMNQVIEFGKNINGAYEASLTTVGGQMSSLARQTEEIKLAFGEAFKPALLVAMTEVNRSLKEMNTGMAANKDGIKSFGDDLATLTAGALSFVKKDLLNVSALILDIKASGYRLGSWAAIPGMVAGSDTYDGMVKTANGYTAAAKAQRDYVEAMKAVAASGGQDPSDQKNLTMARAAAEQKRIAAGNAARAAAESGRKAKEGKPDSFTTDNGGAAIWGGNIGWKREADMIKVESDWIKNFLQEEKDALGSFTEDSPGFMGWKREADDLKKEAVWIAEFIKDEEAAAAKSKTDNKQFNSIMSHDDPIARLNGTRQAQIDMIAEWDDAEIGMAGKKAAALAKIDKDYLDSKAQLTLNSNMEIGSIMSNQIGQMAGMMDQANRDQFNAYKAMMVAQATIATAMAVVGIMAAESRLGMLAIPLAFTAGAIGAAQIGMILGQKYGGARATGGGVYAGKDYLVGERGPEILRMGADSGYVVPNNAIGGKSVTINQTFSITGVAADIMQNTKAIAKQAADAAKNEILNSMNRGGEFALASGRLR
jgi:hypothetical protein